MTQHVLVPLDASEQARKAFDWALEEFDDLSLTILHVVPPNDPGYLPGASVDKSPEDDDYAVAVAEEFLSDFVEEAENAGVEAEPVVVVGEPSREIVGYAEENDVDHVVMGSHGRTGATRVLFGSVAEDVTRRSPTPVTVVR